MGNREHLHDDMILEAIGPRDERNALDAMTSLVYQCAKDHRSIGGTIDTTGLDRELACRIIQELVSLDFIRLARGSVPNGLARRGESRDTLEAQASEEVSNSYVEELERLFAMSQKANYYELLGVDPETPRSEMRSRYFELSKRFHPDKAFGEAVRARKPKMALVFQKLTEAYETLSNANKRAEYNKTIAEELELWTIARKLRRAMSASENPVATNPSMPPEAARISRVFSSSSPPVSNAAPPLGRAPDRQISDNAPRPSFAGSERGSSSTPPGTAKFVPSVAPQITAEARRKIIQRERAGRAMADLLGRRSDGPAPSQVLKKYLDDAAEALTNSRFRDAVTLLKKALEITPDHPQAKEMLSSATAAQAREKAGQHLRRGRYAKSSGELDQAKWHFEQALAIEEDNIDARHLLAEILVETRSQLGRARELMKQVIVLGGQRARYFATLGEIFLLAKELDRATDAFNKALRMEPENKELKKRLRLCKK